MPDRMDDGYDHGCTARRSQGGSRVSLNRDGARHTPAGNRSGTGGLVTESRNPRSMHLDMLPTRDILLLMNDEDALAVAAVRKVVPDVERVVGLACEALEAGGRVFYVGAGTSGRLGVLDAAELVPTFGVKPGRFIPVIAGGLEAVWQSIEEAEDSEERGREDLAAWRVTPNDLVIGLAASGRTPYVVGALDHAAQAGAKTAAVICNDPGSTPIKAQVVVAPLVGPEVLTGSTRLKAGTAQKLILNMVSTATMVRMGATYSNLMVNVAATSTKLRERVVSMVMEASGCGREEALRAAQASDYETKTAILMVISGAGTAEARTALARANGDLREAIERVRGGEASG